MQFKLTGPSHEYLRVVLPQPYALQHFGGSLFISYSTVIHNLNDSADSDDLSVYRLLLLMCNLSDRVVDRTLCDVTE